MATTIWQYLIFCAVAPGKFAFDLTPCLASLLASVPRLSFLLLRRETVAGWPWLEVTYNTPPPHQRAETPLHLRHSQYRAGSY